MMFLSARRWGSFREDFAAQQSSSCRKSTLDASGRPRQPKGSYRAAIATTRPARPAANGQFRSPRNFQLLLTDSLTRSLPYHEKVDARGRRPARNSIVSSRGTRGEAEGASVAPDSEPDESMNSRLSWSVQGIDPSVRERAEAAARRAGMSLSDWLNSTVGDFTPPNFGGPTDQPPVPPIRETPDVLDIHQRLDSITRQIEQISRPAPHSEALRNGAVRGESAVVARQLNEAIS